MNFPFYFRVQDLIKPCLAGTFFCFMVSCATYSGQSADMRSALYARDYDKAIKTINESVAAGRKQDRVLFYMERGMIQYTAGKYEEAAADWAQSSTILDELYTTSLSRELAGLTINETLTDYTAETHERILLPVFSALAYLSENQPEKALVEARKSNEILNVLIKDDKSKEEKKVWYRDRLAHFLSGFIYEMKEEWDAALVEYRTVLDMDNTVWDDGTEEVVHALVRLAEFRKRHDLLSMVSKKFPKFKSLSKQTAVTEDAEVFVVVETGKSPLKVGEDVVVPISGTVVRISFPVYHDVYYRSHGASVYLNSKNIGRTATIADIGKSAKAALSDRRARDLIRLAARVYAKDKAARMLGEKLGPLGLITTNVVAVVTENADTRSWTTLPDSIQVLRFSVPANKNHTVLVQPDSGSSVQWSVQLKPGEKKVFRTRTF